MRRYQALAGLLVTVLTGLVLASTTPANADPGITVRYRIADTDTRTFATASTMTRYVTMQPPSTVIGAQTWVFSDTTIGTTIVNGLTGGCLQPAPSATDPRVPIAQAPCDRRATEFWRVVSATSTTVIFRNLGIDGCMAANPTSTDPARLYLIPCQLDDRNQHFRLVS